MSERDVILNRIQEALRVSAPPPGGHGQAPAPLPTVDQIAHCLPAVGKTIESWLEAFQTAAAELRADFILLPDGHSLADYIAQMAKTEDWKRVATHRGALTDPVRARLSLPILLTDEPYEPTRLEQCDAGISECDALIAQTGSVLVTNRSAGGRALSILPPHHVVLATRDQVLPDLPAAMALIRNKYAAAYPSMISFLTGPSRTGDIERILVLGAHGPKRLTIVCG